MKNVNTLLLTAALSGLMCGTTVAAQSTHNTNSKSPSVKAMNAGLRYAGATAPKHSCKGKNDCKGQGGCATDGSRMPSLV